MMRWFKIVRDNQLLFGSLIFLLVFAFTRYPYYSIVDLPYVFDDTAVYISNLSQLVTQGPGAVGFPLGYPLFLWICRCVSHDISAVVIAQSAVTLMSGLLFLWMIDKSFKSMVLASSIALTIFTSSLLFVHFETTILTECLFANAVVLSTGAIAAVLARISPHRLIAFSLTVILALLIRPTGLYLVPIWLLVAIYVAVSTRQFKPVIMLVAPLALFYGALAAVKMSAPSREEAPYGITSALATNTLSFLKTNAELPDHVNRVIESYVLPRQIPAEQEYIRSSKDIRNVSGLYLKYQTFSYGFRDSLLAANNGSNAGLGRDYSAILDVAKKYHREDLVRFFKVQFLHYFESFDYRRTSAYPFFESFQTCFREARVVNYSQHADNKTGYVGGASQFNAPRFSSAELQSKYDDVTASADSLASRYFLLHHKLFRNLYWVYAFVASIILSLLLLVRRGPNAKYGAFILLLSISTIVYMVVVSVNVSMIRYNFPLHFVFYFVPMVAFVSLADATRSRVPGASNDQARLKVKFNREGSRKRTKSQ